MNRTAFILGCLVLSLSLPKTAIADQGKVRLSVQTGKAVLQVKGDKSHDWRFQISSNLVDWADASGLGVLLSEENGVPNRMDGSFSNVQCFYRAVRTDGLYDITLLRTISLVFTQSNWQTLLANGRTTGSNAVCTLIMDNGATNYGVGARYRGNTSYTGFGGPAPTKKSINLVIDWTNSTSRLMGYKTINLNNAYGDESIMREALYFTVMRAYAVCPKGSQVKLMINGQYWGVYSFAQQENGDLIEEYCPSSNGDRWRAPNMAGGGGIPGGTTGNAALAYLGANVASYKSNYELKTDNSSNAWERLVNACNVLNNTAADQLRDKVETILAVDRWLWFLAIENVFADDDSYWNKGADYEFYYEPESGRIHPVEHDGNEALSVATDVSLSPVYGVGVSTRPVLNKLLSVAELRQRYLAHMRTVLKEAYNPTNMTRLINQFHRLSAADIAADTRKGYTMTAYTNDLITLRTFVTNRYNFLMSHAEVKLSPPVIEYVHGPTNVPTAVQMPWITAKVVGYGTDGIHSTWLYYRDKPYGRFTVAQMFDDGVHADGVASDGVFGAAITNFPAGNKIHYYVEARSGNTARTAAFSPAHAEEDTYDYRVAPVWATNTSVVINEIMTDNETAVSDPQGEFDDWIELLNLTDHEVDLSGKYLSDESNNLRKWQFPSGTTIPANGYLIVWADEDGNATNGLHASFKLDKAGEKIFLADTDANYNAILDFLDYGALEADQSYARDPLDMDVWTIASPTPGLPNK